MTKEYISAQQLLEDSWRLGNKVIASGFVPTWILGMWRGGAPVAIAIHELFSWLGHTVEHNCIKTSLYTEINTPAERVTVEGLEPLCEQITGKDSVLLIDDVFDSGRSIAAVLSEFSRIFGPDTPEIRTATPWYKPVNNQTAIKPDYYLYETAHWLVFPHELTGLTLTEIQQQKPGNEILSN